MGRYVALLRGINVGGKNLIRMTALKACFEAHGFHQVTTFIQSGNVLFETKKSGQAALAKEIEKILAATFKYPASIVLRSHKQMAEVVGRAPRGFGGQPEKYRYDVWFLKQPLKAVIAIKDVPMKEEVDDVFAGPGVLYTRRLEARATQSRLSRVVGTPLYQSLTIRNWNTTTKLLRLLEVDGG